jgi:alpha-2-macroglobulin
LSTPRFALVFTVLALLILPACGGCERSAQDRTEHVTATSEPAPVALEPLPEAPTLDISPEALPGSDGTLAVVVARPEGPMSGEVRPTVTFSLPVKSLGDLETGRAEDRKAPFASIEPKLEGEWRWLGSASAEFVPQGLVPYATEFKVTIHKGLRAINGSTLASDFVFAFSTPEPQMQGASPRSGHPWLRPDEKIGVLFNQPVKDLAARARFVVEGEPRPRPAKLLETVSIADQRREAEAAANPRAYPRLDDETRGYRNQQTRYVLGADRPFPTGRQVTLVIEAGLQAAQGPLPLASRIELDYRTYGPLEISSSLMCSVGYSCPNGPLLLHTSNELEPKSLQALLKVTPEVALDWENARTWVPHAYHGGGTGPYIVIPGSFAPGTSYKVEVAAGAKDVFGQSTARPFSGFATTDDLPPSLMTGGRHALVEFASGPRLPVEVVNLDHLDVSIWNLTPSEMAQALSRPSWESAVVLRPPDFRERQVPRARLNERKTHLIELSSVFGASPTGLALVRLDSPELRWRPSGGHQVLVQVTNLTAHLKLGPSQSLLWVTDLSGGAPVPKATVSLYDAAGKVRWSGLTDESGMADVPGAVSLGLDAQYSWQAPFVMAVARVGDDVGVVSSEWSEGVSAWDFNLQQGWEGKIPEPTGFVFTDRGIYRPGEKVHVKGLARYRSVGALKAPKEGSELTLLFRNSRGEDVKSVPVKITAHGTFSAQLELDPAVPTGHWSVEASGNAPGGGLNFYGGFRVEEYRAPQFKVDVSAAKPELLAGDSLEATVLARYLFGAPMNDAKVRWSVHRGTTTFSPKGHDGFRFGQETWWWDDGAPHDSGGLFASGNGVVDSKGSFALQAGAVEAPGEKTSVYVVEAQVEDVNRQAVANRAELTVHPAAFYVGLRGPQGFRKVGEQVGVDVLVTDPSGVRTGGKTVQVELSRRTWKSVRQKDATGGYSTLSEAVEQQAHACTLQSKADGPTQCAFVPTDPGFYIARATITDDANRRHTASIGLYVTGAGFVAWQRNDTDRIDLVPDKTKYDVGEIAKVLIKSPYPRARALITVEREGVLERRELTLEGSVTTVEVPITEQMVPNLYVGVLVVRPRVAEGGQETGDDPGRPAVRVGYVNLEVERSTRRLAVEVKPDKEGYRPGQQVQLELAVRDHAGKGVPAELTVWVVDESVLRLTNYRTPDPLSAIYPHRPLSTRLGEPLIHLVRQRSYGEKGEEQGGGGAERASEGSGFRGNFQTTVLFEPEVRTDGSGRATVRFKLPDNLTQFRVMAVAVTKDDRFGSGEKPFTVSKPLLALPALPRFARVGDRFEAGVVVHSNTGGAIEAEVTVTAQVENALLQGPAQQKVRLADGKPREVRFGFVADKEGVATFRFRVSRGSDDDGVEQRIPIELAVGLEAVATYGDTTELRTEGLAPPKNARADVGGLELTLASTALGNFQEGFRQLVEYPYGCLEQQSSRLIPFVALRELAPKFGIPWGGPDARQLDADREVNAFFRAYLFDPLDTTDQRDPDRVIAATIHSMASLQGSDGAFHYWPNAGCPSSHASAWATLGLHRASQVGYKVPDGVLSSAQAYLRKVAAGNCSPCERGCPDETRVFAAWVLARTGKPVPSHYGGLHGHRKRLSLFSQALLADAMFVGGGDKAQARKVLQEVLNHAKESPGGIHFEEVHSETYATLWHSDARTTGAVLQTLATISPDHPFVSKIAHYLTSVRRQGRWRTTQEAAFSLLGLTELVRVKEKETPDYIATVLLGDAAIATDDFRGRTTAVKSRSVPMAELMSKTGGKDQNLAFKKVGPGVLYYSALLRYAPTTVPTEALESGLFVQRWFEPYTGGGQATRFHAGDLVRIRVRVSSNQARHFVAVEVPLPAGLEPVDTSLASNMQRPGAPGVEEHHEGYDYEDGESQYGGSAYDDEAALRAQNPWAYSFWSPFNHVEQRDSRVLLFADHLPPGVHVSSFVARATTPGKFVLKPAHGELMYEPEVFGRSSGGTFEVIFPATVSQR